MSIPASLTERRKPGAELQIPMAENPQFPKVGAGSPFHTAERALHGGAACRQDNGTPSGAVRPRGRREKERAPDNHADRAFGASRAVLQAERLRE